MRIRDDSRAYSQGEVISRHHQLSLTCLVLVTAWATIPMPLLVSAASATEGVVRAEVVRVTGPWRILPAEAGTYRSSVRCPSGMRPAGGSATFQEQRPQPARGRGTYVRLPQGAWPSRSVAGAIGHSQQGRVFAELVLTAGPPVKVRITARCRP